MTEFLSYSLRLAGVGLILLAICHVPIGRHLRWNEDAQRMAPANRWIFHVHNLFICLALVLMGLPCVVQPELLLQPSAPGAWGAWSLATFWAARLFVQWFVYPRELWQGRSFETSMHWMFTGIWIGLTGLFVTCGLRQMGIGV